MFSKFRVEGLQNVWISMYCRGQFVETCARKKMRDSGEQPPITLLPNGLHLEGLGDESAI